MSQESGLVINYVGLEIDVPEKKQTISPSWIDPLIPLTASALLTSKLPASQRLSWQSFWMDYRLVGNERLPWNDWKALENSQGRSWNCHGKECSGGRMASYRQTWTWQSDLTNANYCNIDLH